MDISWIIKTDFNNLNKKISLIKLNKGSFFINSLSRPTIPLHKKRTYEKRR